jgi:hypothetical protein
MKLQIYIFLLSVLVISSAAFSGRPGRAEKDWNKLFYEQYQSGETIVGFCIRKDIKPNTFKSTKSRIKNSLISRNVRLPEAFQPQRKKSEKTQPPTLSSHQNPLLLSGYRLIYQPLSVFFLPTRRERLYSRGYNNGAIVATQYPENFMCENCRYIRNNTVYKTTSSPENGNASEPAPDNPFSLGSSVIHYSNRSILL